MRHASVSSSFVTEMSKWLIHCATLVMVSCFLFLVMALFAKLLEKAWYELEILMAHFTLVASCNRKEY